MNAVEQRFARQLGRLLRAERMIRGWSLAEAAGKFGCIGYTTLASYERGQRQVGVETFEKLAAFYGVKPEELLP